MSLRICLTKPSFWKVLSKLLLTMCPVFTNQLEEYSRWSPRFGFRTSGDVDEIQHALKCKFNKFKKNNDTEQKSKLRTLEYFIACYRWFSLSTIFFPFLFGSRSCSVISFIMIWFRHFEGKNHISPFEWMSVNSTWTQEQYNMEIFIFRTSRGNENGLINGVFWEIESNIYSVRMRGGKCRLSRDSKTRGY